MKPRAKNVLQATAGLARFQVKRPWPAAPEHERYAKGTLTSCARRLGGSQLRGGVWGVRFHLVSVGCRRFRSPAPEWAITGDGNRRERGELGGPPRLNTVVR